jgi:TRAP-type mannitol/chloroaromatic compound transport system permease small subunit
MRKLLLFVDKTSTFVGHFFACAIIALTGLISWEVFSRYVLNVPHAWVLDAQIMLYGLLFMMAGAYTLATSGHVRGDVLYGFFSPRLQAGIDLALYILFFLPGTFALTYAGWIYANESLVINEQTFSPEPIPLYPFKFVIPIAGFFLLLQGLVEIARCVICLREGAWPSRVADVAEIDVEKLKEQVHVTDDDIARLDEYIVREPARKDGP